MTEYLDVSTEVARRVQAGELGSGAELWSVREHARRRGTTASTINRAYRCLAEHQVIVLADRRRARVAPDGALAAARFLEPDRVFRLAGSDDPALQLWLDERPDWPGAQTTPALLLNRRGTRLTTRGASSIFRTIVIAGGLDDQITAHIGRHTFATTLVRGGTDLVTVAEMLGHARLETVRAYTRPTAEDRVKALNLLPTDR